VPVVPSEDLLALVARRIRLIAEPVRMRILLLLEQREMTVQALADELLGSHAIADYTALKIIAQATASTTGYIEELADLAKPEPPAF
jgi:DNA-binding transcriptional ArsR family regulator